MRHVAAVVGVIVGVAVGHMSVPSFGVAGLQSGSPIRTHRVSEMKWGPCGAGSPGCAQVSLVRNPRELGFFVSRTKTWPEFHVNPHLHSTDECVVVISGGPIHIGIGDRFDSNVPSAEAFYPGDFYCISAGVHHFAWVEQETVIQVQGVGPFLRTDVLP